MKTTYRATTSSEIKITSQAKVEILNKKPFHEIVFWACITIINNKASRDSFLRVKLYTVVPPYRWTPTILCPTFATSAFSIWRYITRFYLNPLHFKRRIRICDRQQREDDLFVLGQRVPNSRKQNPVHSNRCTVCNTKIFFLNFSVSLRIQKTDSKCTPQKKHQDYVCK